MATALSSAPIMSLADMEPRDEVKQVNGNYDELVQQLVAASTTTYNIHNLKDRFLDKALETPSSSSPSKGGMKAGDPGWELSGRTDPGNPCAMDEEIKGQKDYMRRLKFKYLELEAKLIFLGSITTDEPQTALDDQIDEAERTNAIKKQTLKETKLQAQQIRDEAIDIGRKVEQSHAELAKETQETASLSKHIKEMELELARLRAVYPVEDRMTVSQAEHILDSQVEEMQNLDEQVKTVNQSVDRVREEVGRVAKEVGRMSREKDREEARAKEAKAGREMGDSKVDELCRWYTSAIDLYRQLLGIKSITAISDTELHLEYIIPAAQQMSNKRGADKERNVVLALWFDASTKQLDDAKIIEGSAIDIREAVRIAVAQNDVPGLVAEVLARIR